MQRMNHLLLAHVKGVFEASHVDLAAVHQAFFLNDDRISLHMTTTKSQFYHFSYLLKLKYSFYYFLTYLS
jgi:hypothetical protein